ncbi:sulfatase-like hydrolase/transferase [Salibacterium aidingense]|uniref:sulfatase-like hydrolase/transferase n=1 Tax=Salibacterium aidingense TaxID=384933 RepID=UPI0003FD3704|nr:sulfatase-like hydrolase/transferase [Salibacterium aidingense]
MKPKNILFITSDQQRWDAVSFQNPIVKTPNLERIAKKGIVFNRGYTCSPVCTPARTSLLTGHYPSKHGCNTIGTSLPEDYPTIPAKLSEHGYFTGLIGKAHFMSCLTPGSFEAGPNIYDRDFFREWNGPYFGFDYVRFVTGHSSEKHAASGHYGLWLEEKGIDTNNYFGKGTPHDVGTWALPEEVSNSKWTADETMEAINMAKQKEDPFFLWASFQDPHNPFVVPEPWASMYKKEEVPCYDLQEGEMENKPSFYQDLVDGTMYENEPELHVNGMPAPCIGELPFLEDEKKREMMTKYYGMVSQMDHHIGRILDHLEKTGLIDDTVIVFTSDHGDYMGNHGLWYKGLPAYEDIQKVPFIVSHPDCKTPGDRSESLQSLIDLGNTFMNIAGIDPDPGIQGINQEEAWKNCDTEKRDWVMVEFRPTESSFMQKTFIVQQYKLVVYHNRTYGELYDLKQDHEQLNNLWDKEEMQSIKTQLLQALASAEMEKDGVLRARTAIS